MKFFRAIQCKVWQASTLEQTRNFWGEWEKEETLKTCHERGYPKKHSSGWHNSFS